MPPWEYVGIDRREGRGLDVVAAPRALPFDAKSFDVVFSTETFEHARPRRKIVAEMQRVARESANL